MRKYEFRCWHKVSKQMLYGDSDYQGKCFQWLAEGQLIEIMQWTGLFSKSGKKIFEGDIVQWYHSGIKQIVNGKVEWQILESQFMIWTPLAGGAAVGKGLGHYLNKKPIDESIEVIGNIYENPELMEKK